MQGRTMLRAHFPIWTFVLTSLCLVTALAAQAQREQRLRHVYTLHGDRAGARLGSSLAGGHDLDKGGVADILVGAPLDAAFVNASNGLVRAYRGEDGQALWALRGETGDRFGHAVVMVDDIDGDGVTDFAVGAWGGEDRRAAVPLDQEGYVEFFSSAGGINGYPLSLGRVYGGVAKAHLGEALCRVPDL
ncbi:MAG TPA: integrin alpha, partial [Planctomycetota bacterium]|nr:integrin alpha [Planctomycetota bacterium]